MKLKTKIKLNNKYVSCYYAGCECAIVEDCGQILRVKIIGQSYGDGHSVIISITEDDLDVLL